MAFTAVCPFSILALQGLRARVRLGVDNTERAVPQYVRFDVKLRFNTLPKGCLSDNLQETFCYAKLSETLKAVCHEKDYHLLEHLGWKAFCALKEIVPQPTKLWLRVIKESPPIPDLLHGASFSLGDELDDSNKD